MSARTIETCALSDAGFSDRYPEPEPKLFSLLDMHALSDPDRDLVFKDIDESFPEYAEDLAKASNY